VVPAVDDRIPTETLVAFTDAPTPADRASVVLQACAEQVGASNGAVYVVDTSPRPPFPWVVFGDVPLRPSPVADPASIRPGIVEQGAGGSIVIGVGRGETCVAVLWLDAARPFHGADEHSVLAMASLVAVANDERCGYDALHAMASPVDGDDSSLTDDLVWARSATCSEQIVVRVPEGDGLRCVGHTGISPGSQDDMAMWDLSPLAAYSGLERALGGETVALDRDERTAIELISRPRVTRVLAAPTQVRGGRPAVMTFAVASHLAPTRSALARFAAVARYAGLLQAERDGRAAVAELHRVAIAADDAILSLEIGRSVRHEARGILDNCQIQLRLLAKKHPEVLRISDNLQRLDYALERLRWPSRIGEDGRQPASIGEAWQGAGAALTGRLEAEQVQVELTGTDIVVMASPDVLRHLFLNLMVNSIDAFAGSRSRRRRIELQLRPPSPQAHEAVLVYRDNAGGINPSALRVPPEFEGFPLERLIFEPGVTSKRNGSGFGLWVVRRTLGGRGSIDLVDYRGGVVFAIRLPLHR
jgi:signal transduction histidine kinase